MIIRRNISCLLAALATETLFGTNAPFDAMQYEPRGIMEVALSTDHTTKASWCISRYVMSAGVTPSSASFSSSSPSVQ